MATLISTPQELDGIKNNLSGTYELANDIDMSGFGNFTPIGTPTNPFTGSLDGKGYVIKNLTINETIENVGLIGYASNFEFIRNLGMENCSVTSNQNSVGAIIGFATNANQECSNLYVKDSQVQGFTRTGGLFGQVNKSNVRDSFSLNNDITAEGLVGGVIGRFYWLAHTLINVYSASKVTDTNYNVVGGLIGGDDTTDTSLYSGLYFDTQVSTQSTDPVATGKTTAEMKTQSTYTGWDFTDTWVMADYPTLQVFGVPVIPPKTETVSVNSYINKAFSDVSVKLPPKTEKLSVNSFMDSINGHTDVAHETSRDLSTYVSSIHSNVTTRVYSPNSEIRDVSSYINVINSSVVTETFRQPVSVTRNVISHVKPIQTIVDVETPVIPVYGHISVMVNRSNCATLHHLSYPEHIQNQSYCEVVK